jgi:hypothetical protein
MHKFGIARPLARDDASARLATKVIQIVRLSLQNFGIKKWCPGAGTGRTGKGHRISESTHLMATKDRCRAVECYRKLF